MCDEKLRTDEVPKKFSEWLLAMGCPSENLRSLEKVAEMCRGQYYLVWRSLMERVEPKDTIRIKRLQVFCDDIQKCQKKNTIFNERDTNVVEPEELSLWKQQTQLKERVEDAELRVAKEKENMKELMDKISSKLSHRSLIRKKLQGAQRRAWLLHQMADELEDKRASLLETKTIADSLCGMDEGTNIDNNLEKYMNSSTQRAVAASSSVATTDNENDDEVMSSLVKSRGDVLMEHLHARRLALCTDMPELNNFVDTKDSVTPNTVLAHTAALHCTLALEAAKNRVHIKTTREKLAVAVNDISNYLSGTSCELLVSRCEVSRGEARLQSLRGCARDLATRAGAFAPIAPAGGKLHRVDAAIETKRDELKRLMASVAAVERKTVNVRDCLVALFSSFHDDGGSDDRFGGRSSLPQDTVSALHQFYLEKSEKRNNLQLSMDFDVSESFTDVAENGNPKFADELKLYLKKFKLENNRKFVLDSGEKIWTFESVQSSLDRIRAVWQSDDVTTPLLCPAISLKHNLCRLVQDTARKAELEDILRSLEQYGKDDGCRRNIDITSKANEELNILDKIKKRLNENIQSLQKTNKTLNIGKDNIQFWSDNSMKKYISDKRNVDGKSYKEYENAYLEYLDLYK